LSITGQLAASIAHEVRNPLAAIRSTVQMIRDEDAAPNEHGRLLNTVIDEVDRVNDVLSHMLVLGRPHTTRQESCNVAEIADSASDFCSPYAKRRGQQIVRTGTETLWVQGDPHELRQVLVNVLLNACQASGSQAIVLVETVCELSGSEGPWAIVRVSDRGTGIPARDLPRVFEAFFSTKTDGGGLGLSLCREIVLRHNGKIEIDSTPDVGTTVTVYLPSQ
jgi:signal transduction histidine kinase